MCAYPTKNLQTRYPKHAYFFYLALATYKVSIKTAVDNTFCDKFLDN